jgi:O-antigen/teichoic acid export membrane protein
VGYLLLMSGNEKRLIKVQIAMAVMMIACCAALVPLWGIVGASVAAALTNVGMNVWNLLEVRKALGISPYNRGYLRLLLPTLLTLAATLALRKYSYAVHRDWLAIGITLGLAYCIFWSVVLMGVLDADDRLIATAIWSRIQGALSRNGARA